MAKIDDFVTQVSRDDEQSKDSSSVLEWVLGIPGGLWRCVNWCVGRKYYMPSLPLSEHNFLPSPKHALLPPQSGKSSGKKCLVLDLDETLVHSSFKPIANPDFIVPVEIENTVHKVYVLKRPRVDHFLREAAKVFELVVFTASLAKYANPVMDILDPDHLVEHRLYREHCTFNHGTYAKDMSRLGRDLSSAVIVDNSPHSYAFHPRNALHIESWFDSPSDRALDGLLRYLIELDKVDDVTLVLNANNPRPY